MDESGDTMSSKDLRSNINPAPVKGKPKKRSLVERELETNLTEKITTPIVNSGSRSGRYGRKLYIKNDSESNFTSSSSTRSVKIEKTPVKVQSPIYRMHASNSPVRGSPKLCTSPQLGGSLSPKIENQIESIYKENQSLSRFSTENKIKEETQKQSTKVYIRQDLIQSREKEKEEPILLIKNLFSPMETYKSSKVALEDRPKNLSSPYNVHKDNSSVVKTLDFDDNKNRKDSREKNSSLSKNEIDIEANCEYQVGDIAWARVGTYPFWPCIVTRDPSSGKFVKKKLFNRNERDVIHVTFFGDNGRRGWIVDNMLRKYKGKSEFEATRQTLTAEIKKRDPRLYAAFFVSEKKQALWNISVEEAETTLKEPKRLRIDLLNSMLESFRETKVTTKREKSAKINRTNSDVSLSESLYDTLFSETDERSSDADKSKRKSRNPSLDVSEVVTACLDDMAAKTGISSIKRQSHMDRWLQKAKSNTPEKLPRSQAGKSRERSKTRQVSVRGSSRFRSSESQRLLKNENRNSEYQSSLILVDSDSNTNSDSIDDNVIAKRLGSVFDIDNNKTEDHNYCKSPTKPDFKENSVKDKIKRGNQCDRRTRSSTNNESNYNNETIIANVEPDKMVVSENSTKKESISEISNEAESNDIDKCNISKCQGVRSDQSGKSGLEIVNGHAKDFQDNSYKDNINKVNINENENINNSTDSDEKRDKTQITNNTIEKSFISDILTEDTDKSCIKTSGKIDDELSTDESNLINNVDENSVTFTQPQDEILNTSKNPDNQSFSGSVVNDDKISTENFLLNSDKENSSKFSKDQDDKISASSNPNKQNLSKSFHKDCQMFIEERFLISNDDENSMTFSQLQDDEILNTLKNPDKQSFSESVSGDKMPSEIFLLNNDEENSRKFSKDQDDKISASSSNPNKQNLSQSFHKDCQMSIDERFLINNDDENSESFSPDPDVEISDFSNCHNKENLLKTFPNDGQMSIDESFLMNNDDEHSESYSPDPDVDISDFSNCHNEENLSNRCHKDQDERFLIKNDDENSITFSPNHDIEISDTSNCHNKRNLSRSCHNDRKMSVNDSLLINSTDENSMTFTQDQDVETLDSSNRFKDHQNVSQNFKGLLNSEGNLQKITTDATKKIGLAKNISDPCVEEQSKINESSTNLPESENVINIDNCIKIKENGGQTDIIETDNITGNEYRSSDNIKKLNSAKNSSLITYANTKSVTINNCLIELAKKDLLTNNHKNFAEFSSINNKKYITTDIEPVINFENDQITDVCITETKSTNKTSNGCLIVDNHIKLRKKYIKSDGSTPERITNPDKTAFKSSELSTPSRRSLKAKNRTSAREKQFKATQEPDFISYLESKQDKILEENPELTQEEVTKYLYNAWLYKEDKKTDFKTADDIKSFNLVKGLNDNFVLPIKRNKRTATLEIMPPKKKRISKDNMQSNFNGSIKKYFKSTNCVSNQIKTTETPEIEVKQEIDNKNEYKNISTKTKISNSCSENVIALNGYTESIEGRPEKNTIQEFDPQVTSISCEIGVSLVNKGTDRCVESFNYTLESHQDPEFTKYLELKQDALIEENSELSHDDIVKYLYKTWLYTKNIKTELQENNTDKVNVTSNQNTVSSTSMNCEANEVGPDKKISEDSSIDNVTAETESGEKDKSSIVNLNNETEKKRLNYEDILVNTVNSECIAVKVNGHVGSKEGTPETIPNQELDSENVASSPEVSVTPSTKRRIRMKYDKSINHSKKTDEEELGVLTDPEFLKYMELKQDELLEENPELTHDEIVKYLYKTWLYGTSNKSELKRNEEIEQLTLVKGLNQDAVLPVRKYKKRPKIEKTETKIVEAEIVQEKDTAVENCNEKPKRKVAKACYNEDFFDFESEFKVFEIFRTNKNKINNTEDTKIAEVVDVNDGASDDCDYGDEEVYFEELTTPKPNLFKGLIREKVCEICESPSELVKCKGCHCFFHIACVKKELEAVDTPVPSKGRRKKKKARGRRPKDGQSIDSECNSDDKSQDANVSDELNVSFDEIDLESHLVADADIIEAHLSANMKELLENTNSINYECNLRKGQLDWKNSVAGKCEIVDVQLNLKLPFADSENSDFKCNNCQKYDVPVCFVCRSNLSPKTGTEFRQRCQVAHCHRYYHLECLDYWPQTHFSSGGPSKNSKKSKEHFEAISCPRHVCHTCVCDDPRGCKTRFSGDKLARCVRCPATYHSFTKCLPAGSQILTGSHIICPRHTENRPGKVPCHVNTGWCYICTLGGTLMCCEYCPMACHAECLNIKPPDGVYMCEDCETGRLPLYGEMVWTKLGHYRWWPGIILHPSQVPANVMAVKHSQGEFVVRFFGQYDHYWVNRGRVFPYQEDDSLKSLPSQKSKINADFTKAIEHAKRACEILKNAETNAEEQMEITSSLMPPHYVKLKVNKPVGGVTVKRDEEGESLTQCDCDPNQEDPCGPLSQCLNRMLLTECGPSCRAGDRCSNRAFEKRQYPRLEPYRTPHRGWGLRTLDFIPQGQFVIEYVGELIDEKEFQRRMRLKHDQRDENYYFLTLDKERMIDAGPKGNLARFMNHCCDPNCETQKWTVLGDIRVGLFALRDIPENSEVTFNYNLESAGIEKKRCLCGAKRCSGYIGAKPKQDIVPKKTKFVPKKTYHKKKVIEISPTTSKRKPKIKVKRVKPKELTEIEKDLLIIKNATNGLLSDGEGCDGSEMKERTAQKRKRVNFSTDEKKEEPSSKKTKLDV